MQIFNRKNKVDELRKIVEQNNKQINERIDKILDKLEGLKIPEDDEINKRIDNVLTKIDSLKVDKESIPQSKGIIEKSEHQLLPKIKGGKQNTSGIYRVSYNKQNKQWKFSITKKGRSHCISKKSLRDLEKKVKLMGYDWIILDKKQAKISYELDDENIKSLKNKRYGRNVIKREPNSKYIFPTSYKKICNLKIYNDGMVANRYNPKSRYEPTTILNLFKLAKFPILNKQYKEIIDFSKSCEISYPTSLTFLYNVQNELKVDNGDLLELLFTIYKNNYDVPFFINFGRIYDNVSINEKDTGITCTKMQELISECNNSLHPQCTIVRLMHNNQDLNQRYLFYCLMNYGNDMLNEIL